MSYSAKQPKRTIRDVSHHFLSQVPSAAVRHIPVVGCYLAKGVTHIGEALQLLLLNNSPAKAFSTQVCYLRDSNLVIPSSELFRTASFSLDEFQRGAYFGQQSSSVQLELCASAYYFLFREDDCLMLDPIVSSFGAVILAGDVSGKDLTEMYKVIKGFQKQVAPKQWLLSFCPELDLTSSRLAIQEVNKVTQEFLNTQVHLLHSKDPERSQIWVNAVEQVHEQAAFRQNAFAYFIDQKVKRNEDISQESRP